MPDSLGIPDASSGPLIEDGPNPASAGAGWAATTHALDQFANIAGGFEQLAAVHAKTVADAQMAQINSHIETQQQAIAGANQFNAGAFQEDAAKARSDFIGSLPAQFAQPAAQQWDLKAGAKYREIYGAGIARDQVVAVQGLNQRLTDVTQNVTNEMQSGAPLNLVMQSPTVRSGIDEQNGLLDSLVASKAISPETANAQRTENAKTWKAAAFQGHVMQVFQSQGAAPAIAELERVSKMPDPSAATDPNAWESGQAITPDERAMMVAKGRSALTSAISLQQEQTNIAQAQQTQARTALETRLKNSVAQTELTGHPDTSITQADFTGIADGPALYVQHLHDVSDAQIKHNATGDLAQYASPEAAASRLTDIADLKDAPKEIKTPGDLDAAWNTVKLREGGVDSQGRPRVSSDGKHFGVSQLSVGTAQIAAGKLAGTDPEAAAFLKLSPGDQQRTLMSPDQGLNERLGRQTYSDMVGLAKGDPTLGYLGYHNGPGVLAGGWTDGKGNHRAPLTEEFGDPRTGEVTIGDFQSRLKAAGLTQTAEALGGFANATQGGRAAAAYSTLRQDSGAWALARAGNVGDPINFAREHSLAGVQPLDINGLLNGNGAGLQARLALGQTLAAKSGVPVRVLTNAEAQAIQSRMDSDPTLGPKLGATLSATLGAGPAQSVLREAGENAGQAGLGVHIGWLSTQGPNQQRFAAAAAAGIADQARGAKQPPLGFGSTWPKEASALAPAFENMPGALATIMQAAESARLHDAQTRAPGTAKDYLLGATGGVHGGDGQTFGGVTNVNGRPTLLPTWMEQSSVRRALQIAGDALGPNAPIMSNSQPARGRDIANMVPVALANGRYGFRQPGGGNPVMGRDGQPFTMDFEAAKPLLTRAGGIVAR